MATQLPEYITRDALVKLSVGAGARMQHIAANLLGVKGWFSPVWIIGCEGEHNFIRAYNRSGECIASTDHDSLQACMAFDFARPLTIGLMDRCRDRVVSELHFGSGEAFAKYTSYHRGILIVPSIEIFHKIVDIINKYNLGFDFDTVDGLTKRIQEINRTMDALHKERDELHAEVNARCEKH